MAPIKENLDALYDYYYIVVLLSGGRGVGLSVLLARPRNGESFTRDISTAFTSPRPACSIGKYSRWELICVLVCFYVTVTILTNIVVHCVHLLLCRHQC